MEIIYRSFDGKEFETFAECAQYENKTKTKSTFYDEMGIPTEDIDSCFYADIVDDEGLEALKLSCEKYDNEYPDCWGKWIYDTRDEVWISFEEIKEKYSEYTKIFGY